MKRAISAITLLAAAALPAAAAITGQWVHHPTFDNSVTQVIDTPTRTYFTGYPQSINERIPFKANPDLSLFYYDKENEEVVSAVQRHDLTSTVLREMQYNPDKGYLLIIYDDQDIDLLHDDGSVSNIGAIRNASIPGSKAVNCVTFDNANDLIWLATDFGYVAIDDERLEVAESRNYSEQLDKVFQIGDYIYIFNADGVSKARRKDSRMRLDEYTATTEFSPEAQVYMLGDSRLLVIEPDEKPNSWIRTYDIKGDDLSLIFERTIANQSHVRPAERGYTVMDYGTYILVRADNGQLEYARRPESEKGKKLDATWDMKTMYGAQPRKGLREYKRASDGTYTVSHDYMLPNAPNAYYSRNMLYHPRYGMLVSTFGYDHLFNDNSVNDPHLVAGHKDGFWTPLSAAYRNPQQLSVGNAPIGMAIDPDDDRYLYSGSNFSGLTRLNLDDAQDILHFTHPADANASLPGFVKIHDTSTKWARVSTLSCPQFDADKRLWTLFFDYDDPSRIRFYFWEPADRIASKDAASARPWKTLGFKLGDMSHMQAKFLTLQASVNRNMIIYMSPYGLFVLDHNGTPDNTSDDSIKSYNSVTSKMTDQDGNQISFSAPNYMYEDPQTGIVWICNAGGIFYCTPRNLMQGQPVLNRVKVSRDDGTSLADYLLNGVEVNAITRDGDNRMWIATTGAGVIVTSADGKKIYEEFKAENSGLPSNMVYDLAYDPASRSVMISTSKGLTEFLIGGAGDSASRPDEVRAYPNPVDPDYYGWVTIDGLPENSLVKIVDGRGTLVRELGRAEGGSVQWDVNNLHYRRVQTGVYYILASPASDGSGETRVGKILVMN